MRRFLTPCLCLLSMLLAGCPSAPPVAEAESEPIPELTMLGSEELFSVPVRFFALSEDGSTFIAGSQSSVGLYRASDYAPLERYYIREDEPSTAADDTASHGTDASIYDLGYIDTNTWYFTERTQNDIRVHVRTIQPSREVFVSVVNEIPYNSTASANRNYIAYNNELINWRTGEHHATKTWFLEPKWRTVPTLTPDNRIITYPHGKTVIFDPLNDTMESWGEAARLGGKIIVTPDNRHAIGLSTANYKCTLWLWPERKKVGHCSERLGGIFGRIEYFPALELSLDGKFFAVGVNNTVRVYRIEPFKLELEATTPGPVAQLALSDNGLLAAYDYRGFLRIWNIATGSLAGQRSLFNGELYMAYSPKLAFQPRSGKLFTTYGGITVFEIPRQAAQQKAESDPGTWKE